MTTCNNPEEITNPRVITTLVGKKFTFTKLRRSITHSAPPLCCSTCLTLCWHKLVFTIYTYLSLLRLMHYINIYLLVT